MIRQDKITFLISNLKAPELYSSFLSDESVHHNIFIITPSIDRILKRIGVFHKSEYDQSQILTKYIPVNKHRFLKRALTEFSKDYCIEYNPLCEKCYLGIGCDYYNKKNDWVE